MLNEYLQTTLLQERYQPFDNFRTFLSFCKSFRFYYFSKQLKKNFKIKQLKKLLLHADKHVPFYRNIFDKLNVTQRDINEKTESVLQLLPILSKDDIITHGQQYFISSYFKPNQLIHVRTSGSNRRYFDVFYDKNSFIYLNMVRIRSQILCGMRPWHKLLIVTGDQRPPVPSERWFNKCSLFRTCHISGFEALSKLNEKFKDFNPDILIGYPTLLDSIGKGLCEDAKKSIYSIFTSGEPLSTELEASLSKDYSAKITDFYGAGEFESIAFRCHDCQMYHINEDTLWVEKTNSNLYQKSDNNFTENLAFTATNLWSYAMPLIRYRTEDVIRYSKCCCKGRHKKASGSFSSIKRARKLDFIRLSNGETVSTVKLNRILSQYVTAPKYQFVETRQGMLSLFLSLGCYSNKQASSLIKALEKGCQNKIKFEIQPLKRFYVTGTGKYKHVITALDKICYKVINVQ
ncbi:MAG: hypothetical protein DRP65_00890 [Planctomycetota bacterium]|nr:MAG: hypothetical protein DRP65_00890 [Planctomycetota bacterium]